MTVSESFDKYITSGLGIFTAKQQADVAKANAKAAQSNATLQSKLAELAKNKTLMIGIVAAVVLVVVFFFRRGK